MRFRFALLSLSLALLANPSAAHAGSELYGIATLKPEERAELEGIRDKVRACDEQFGSAEQVCDYDAVLSSIQDPRKFAETQCEEAAPFPTLAKQLAREFFMVPD